MQSFFDRIRRLNSIYRIVYDIRVKNHWWSYKYHKWVSLDCDGDLSSTRVFHSRRKAFAHFDELTKNGLYAIMNDRKIKFWKSWYFENEWYAEDQTYFNENNYTV
jgi:hypothetical protein